MKISIWENGEYSYENAFGFVPNLTVFLHDDYVRPAIIIVPGGGYQECSPTEGLPVAERFFAAGYQCFVLTYTTNVLRLVPVRTQPLRDLARSVRLIRKNAQQWQVDSKKVIVMGFSAGGHLAGWLGSQSEMVTDPDPGLKRYSCRPTATVLAYPVVLLGAEGHQPSTTALLGNDILTARKWSLTQMVSAQTVPCFIWHTLGDATVPAVHSIRLIECLERTGIPFAAHLFTTGGHGLSLATKDLQTLRKIDLITLAQAKLAAVAAGQSLSEFNEQRLVALTHYMQARVPNSEVETWVPMVQTWLAKLLLSMNA